MATATANAQNLEFRGSGKLSAFSPECAANNWPPGRSLNAKVRYRPPQLGGNGRTTRLAFHFGYYATSFVLSGGVLTSEFKTVVGGWTGSQTRFYAPQPKLRVTRLVPATITMATPKITVEGDIEGFDAIPTCSVHFEATLPRR